MKVLQLPTISDENKEEAKKKVIEFFRTSHYAMAENGVSYLGILEMEDGTVRLAAAKDKDVLAEFLEAMTHREPVKRYEIEEARSLQ